jgi:DNA-binding MarR family transcriptional regulator
MSLSSESLRIRLLIKRLMKKNGYQYADLAKVWGVSTPTVKRIMTRDEMSLERLIAVASWLKIALHELIALASQDERGSNSFTDEQEEYLAQRPLEWLYFHWILTGHTPADLTRRLDLPHATARRALKALDELGLLDTSGEEVRVTTPGPYQMKLGGPLERIYFPKVMHAIMRRFSRYADGYRDASRPDETTLVRPFEMVLRAETYHEMVRELRETVIKYRLRSRLEMAVEPADKLHHITGIMAADFYYPWMDALGIKRTSSA